MTCGLLWRSSALHCQVTVAPSAWRTWTRTLGCILWFCVATCSHHIMLCAASCQGGAARRERRQHEHRGGQRWPEGKRGGRGRRHRDLGSESARGSSSSPSISPCIFQCWGSRCPGCSVRLALQRGDVVKASAAPPGRVRLDVWRRKPLPWGFLARCPANTPRTKPKP